MLSKGSCTHPIRTTLFQSGLHFVGLQSKHGSPFRFLIWPKHSFSAPAPRDYLVTAVILDGANLSQQGDEEPFVKGISTKPQKL